MLTDRFRSVPRASLFDLTAILLLFAGGLAFHGDLKAWTVSLFGECHFGDSELWWDGALRVAEGHLHNHPGQGMRPGFFVLAGLAVPVLGDSVEAFHKFLLSFAYKWPLDAGPMPADGELLLRVEGVRQGTARLPLRAARETTRDAHSVPAPRAITPGAAELDGLDAVEVTWESVGVPAPVCVYEPVVRAEELGSP
jgi:hypothetical protein